MAGITYNGVSEGNSVAWVGDELKQREAVLVSGGMLDPATFTADSDGRKFVESGTLVGRTYAERDAGAGFGPVAVDGTSGEATDNEVYLLLHDVYDAERDASATFYRPGRLVYERHLPQATRDQIGVVRALWQTQFGEE